MGTEIAVANQGRQIEKYGSRQELSDLAERFLQFFNVPSEKIGNPDVQSAALTAAQLTLRFGLTPRLHIAIVERGGKYQAEETLEAWKEAADKHSRIGRFLYDVQIRPMTPEEVKEYTPEGTRHTPKDRGAWARVIRFDIARQYKEIGMQYDPPWVAGFWRAEAYEEKEWKKNANGRSYPVGTGKFNPDTVPNQRTPQDVAERRATRAALKRAFSLIQLDDYTEEQRTKRAMLEMQRQMEPEPAADVTLFAEKATEYEEDGDVVWATQPPRSPRVVAVEAPAPAPAPQHRNGANVYHTGGSGELLTADNGSPIPVDVPGFVADWQSAADAYSWARAAGACDNEMHARGSMKKIVDEQFGGKFTKVNQLAIFVAYYRRQAEKLAEQGMQAWQDASEDDPFADAGQPATAAAA